MAVSSLTRFIVPSAVGVLFFLTPVKYDGNWTIGMGALSDAVIEWARSVLPAIATVLVCVAAVLSLVAHWAKPNWLTQPGVWSELFAVSLGWTTVRVLGAAVSIMVLLQIGPAWIHADATGGTILNTLAVILVVYFFFAGVLLPFLTHFGLMEFIGTHHARAFR